MMTDRTGRGEFHWRKCSKGERPLADTWPLREDQEGVPFEVDDWGIVNAKVSASAALQFHLHMEQGRPYREFQYQQGHLCYWETTYYKEAITTFLEGVDPRGKTALDAGCGDGRFTDPN